jgi:uncharacterized SAM-binding protein YcdF (DUF218 family)
MSRGARRLPQRWRVAVSTLIALIALWCVSLALVLLWERVDTTRHSAAIVVLGAAQYHGRPSPVLAARLDHAIALWRAGWAPWLVFTGGLGSGDTISEAAASRRYALQRGVPDSAILLENEGRTTSESLRSVAALLAGRSSNDVILVSDPFHMLRLSILAYRFGLHPHTSPTRSSPISANSELFWRYALSESVKAPWAFFFERR